MLIVFGGSFNPPTKAHLELIELIKAKYQEAKILIVPTSKKNYTWKKNLIDDKYRYEMLAIQFKDIEISKYEEECPKYLGTYQMLNDFKEIDNDIYFLIGTDNFNQMPLWLNFNKLIAEFKFIVIKRKGIELDFKPFKGYEDRFTLVDMDSDISSTKVRENVDKYRSYLIDEVYQYIKEHHLYEEEN